MEQFVDPSRIWLRKAQDFSREFIEIQGHVSITVWRYFTCEGHHVIIYLQNLKLLEHLRCKMFVNMSFFFWKTLQAMTTLIHISNHRKNTLKPYQLQLQRKLQKLLQKEDQEGNRSLQWPTCQTVSHPSEDEHSISFQNLRLFQLCEDSFT